MKLTSIVLLSLCLVVSCSSLSTDYDYEEEEAPAVPVATSATASTPGKVAASKAGTKLGTLLSSRNRGAGALPARKSPIPAPGGSAGQTTVSAKSTTTTEIPAEQLEDEYDEDGEEVAKQNVAAVITSTESPKQLGRGGVVRPFRRSNEDLLAALKRRRAQGTTSSQVRETTTTQVPSEAAQSKYKSQSTGRSKVSNANEVPKGTSRVRFGATRTKASPPSTQEEAQETRSEDVQVKPKSFRRG